MPRTWNIAIALQVMTDIDRQVIHGVVGYGTTNPNFCFRDIRFLNDEDVPAKLRASDFDGAIINYTRPTFEELKTPFPDIPLVNIGTDKLCAAIPSVRGLRGEASGMLLAHLRQHGYRRFAYVDVVPVDERNLRVGNLRELLHADDGPMEAYCLPGYDLDGVEEKHVKKITEWLREIADPSAPTGVVTYDGYRAAAVVEACRRLGLSIPQAIGIATYVETRVCLTTLPSITSAEVPGYEIGYAAMRLLHEILEGKQPPQEPVEIAGGGILVRGSTAEPDVFRDEIELATQFMEKNCANQVTVNDCLAHLGTVSRSSFYRSFARQMGMPPGEYLRSLKVKRAKELLITTPFSITRVAELCGFSSRTQLNNTFGLVVGKSPTQYRRNMKGKGQSEVRA